MNSNISSNPKVINAAYDYRYLLSRGYPVKPSLDLIATRYSLSRKEKLLLYRCIHTQDYIDKIKSKLVCRSLDNYVLFIDFYNILISVVNMLEGGEVYLCDDCVPRDLRGSKLRNSDSPYIVNALTFIIHVIKMFKPQKVVIVVDKNVSFSLNHIHMFRDILRQITNLRYDYELTLTPDKRLIDYSKEYNSVIATSDFVIMSYSSRIAPISYVVMHLLKINPSYNFADIFSSECFNCFDDLVNTINEYTQGNT